MAAPDRGHPRGLLVLILVVLAGLWALTPSVGDAEQRVATFTADHHAGTLHGAVPEKYATALVATEDSRFYSHHGIDSLGAARAALGIFGGQDQGGSTLDQQLAKTLYSNGQRSTTDIVEQVVLGAKLDHAYPRGRFWRCTPKWPTSGTVSTGCATPPAATSTPHHRT